MPVANLSSNYQLDWDVAQSGQNISSNTSTVYGRLILRKTGGSGFWTSEANPWSIGIDGQNSSGSYTYDFRNYSELWLWQGTVTITHNADGTKWINTAGQARMDSPWGEATIFRELTLSTIPRASKASFASSPVTGNAVTIYTNRASGSFTHDITWGFGTLSGTIATGVGASVSWTPPHTLFNQSAVKNTAAGTGSITTVTKNGGTVIGTTTTGFTLTLNGNQKPTLTSVSLEEAVTSPVNIATVIGQYVQSQSKLSYSFSGATGIQGSTVSSYSLSIGSVSASGSSGVSPFLKDSGSVSVSATVTDSRGRVSVPWTTTVNVLAWSPPQITSLNVERARSNGTVDPNGTYLKVTFVGVVSNLTVGGTQKNTLTYLTDTAPAGSGTWTNKRNTSGSAPSTSANFLISSYAESSAWDVRTVLRDRFAVSDATSQAVVIRNIPVASVGLDLGPANAGVGKFWERGTLDVGGDIYTTTKGFAMGGGFNHGSTALRDTIFGSPANDVARVALANQQVVWWNTDKNWEESYYAPASLTGLTVRGLVAGAPAGWYPITPGPRATAYATSSMAQAPGTVFNKWSFTTNLSAYTSHASFIELYDSNRTLRTKIAGRFRMSGSMYFQNGNGTGVFSYRGDLPDPVQYPVPLLAGYGQTVQYLIPEFILLADQGVYWQTDSGQLTVGNPNSPSTYLSLEYLGPAFV